jgi:hypothetical protein
MNKIDTEHLFGFVTGTDIGEVGDKEIETETIGRLHKRTGSYSALSQAFAFEYTPVENLRVELAAIGAYYGMSGVTGLDDLRRSGFQGVSLEMRYRLLDRERTGVGLTLLAEPHWGRFDEISGQRADQYGAGLAVLLDRELVRDRIVAAFNLLYEPEVTRSRITGAWSQEATLGVAGAVMARLGTGFFAGIETRYLRAYESFGFDNFAGHALFVGPTIFYQPSERWRITASWNAQVAGKAVSDSGALNLMNFTRHQFRLRIGYHF